MSGWIAALLWFPLIGAALARVARFSLPGDPISRWGMVWLTGYASSGVLLFALGVLRVPLALSTLAAIAAISLVISLGLRNRHEEERIRWPLLPSALMIAPLLVLMLQAAILPVTDYDGRAFWVLKGKAIAQERAIDGPFFEGRSARNLHSEYPLLVPLGEAVVFILGGDLDDRHVRPTFALLAIAFLLALRHRLASISGAGAAAWIAAALAWIPQFVALPEGSAASAYADVPFAAFFGLAAARIAMPGESRRDLPLWLAAIVLTKNEGIAAAIAILAALALARLLHGGRWPAAPFGAAAIATLLLSIWRARVPLEFDENYGAMMATLPERSDRVPEAAAALLRRAFVFDSWGLFWYAAVVAALIAITGKRWRIALIAIVAGAAQCAAYVATYAISPWILRDLAGSSGSRLLLHLIGCAAIVIASMVPGPENGRAPRGPTA
jgi:hypothetical protein